MIEVSAEAGLPDLSKVFFPDDGDDHADHADDSCCLSLNREWLGDDAARWLEVLEQHMSAFIALTADASFRADGEDRSWYMGRPLVFSAHHVVELALKMMTLPAQDEWSRGRGNNGHVLAHLLELDRNTNGVRGSRDWEDEFVKMLDQAQEGGRYPSDRKSSPLLDQWCCVSASALDKAVTMFVYLVVPAFRGVDDD